MSKKPHYFDLEREQDRVRIVFTEENLASRDEMDALFDRLHEILNMTPKPDLLFDFRLVRHIASVFLGKLMGFHRQVKSRGGKLRLVNVNPNVHEVFILTRINEQISIDTTGAAETPGAAGPDKTRLGLMVAGGLLVLVVIAWLLVR